MNTNPDLDRVAEVIVTVALRLSEHDEKGNQGRSDAHPRVLSRLD